jgi:hypothetical protein
MPAADHTERVLIARVAAHTRWAAEADRTAATAPARRGLIARFERQVDPDGLLPEDERQRRAQSALRAHMARMAQRSVVARRRRRPS